MGVIEDVVREDKFKDFHVEEWAKEVGLDEDEMVTLIVGLKERMLRQILEGQDPELAGAESIAVAFHMGVVVGQKLVDEQNKAQIHEPWKSSPES